VLSNVILDPNTNNKRSSGYGSSSRGLAEPSSLNDLPPDSSVGKSAPGTIWPTHSQRLLQGSMHILQSIRNPLHPLLRCGSALMCLGRCRLYSLEIAWRFHCTPEDVYNILLLTSRVLWGVWWYRIHDIAVTHNCILLFSFLINCWYRSSCSQVSSHSITKDFYNRVETPETRSIWIQSTAYFH